MKELISWLVVGAFILLLLTLFDFKWDNKSKLLWYSFMGERKYIPFKKLKL